MCSKQSVRDKLKQANDSRSKKLQAALDNTMDAETLSFNATPRLLSHRHPWLYWLAVRYHRCRRSLAWMTERATFARKCTVGQPWLVKRHSSRLIKLLGQSDLRLQYNKVENLKLILPLLGGCYPGTRRGIFLLPADRQADGKARIPGRNGTLHGQGTVRYRRRHLPDGESAALAGAPQPSHRDGAQRPQLRSLSG
jgi:hypothetical protein